MTTRFLSCMVLIMTLPYTTMAQLPVLSAEGNKLPAERSLSADQIVWQRDVYRMIDLSKEQNAPLYFPPQPDGLRKNLFSLLFEEVANGNIEVYDYVDGKELFTAEYRVKFDDLLNRFWIPYEQVPHPKHPKDTLYRVETADVPSNEVTLYYIKESYFLDATTSSIRIKPICFCPVLVREDEMGEMRRYPLFWVPFDGVRELLSTHSLSTSSYNAAMRSTLYDYFYGRHYQGDIYKVYNLQNQNIMDYCSTPEEIEAERQRLEKELTTMTESLWIESQSEALEREKAAQENNKKPKR